MAVAVVLCAVGAAPAAAATIAVNTLADPGAAGTCSLRQAVEAANTDGGQGGCAAGSGADTIVLGPGTHKLAIAPSGADDNAAGDLNLSGTATISGAGASATILDAQ